MINIRILTTFLRLVFEHSNASDKEKTDVSGLLTILALKLTAVWHHKKNYIELEDKLVLEARASPIEPTGQDAIRLRTAQGLYLELDGFLVQLKSTLDHMTSILAFGMGLPFSGLTTFGDKGNKVVTQLRRNVARELKPLAERLAQYVEKNHEWLGFAISVRDRMNHYKDGGLSLDAFMVYAQAKDGAVEVSTPRLQRDQTVRELLEVLYINLFDFVEHFLGIAFIPRLPGVGLRRINGTAEDVTLPRWESVPIEFLRSLEPKPGFKPYT